MIKRLTITKFRQLENIEYKNFDRLNEFYGSNGCGKTTCLDAIKWVLTGETILFGKTDSDNVDVNKPYEPIEVELEVNDDVFKRVYKNVYNEENDTTKVVNEYFVNGRKCKNQNEYYSALNRTFNVNVTTSTKINMLECFVNPFAFGMSVDEKKFRTFLDEILKVDTVGELLKKADYELIKADFKKQGNYNNLKDFYKQEESKIDSEIQSCETIINSCTLDFSQEEYDKLTQERKDHTASYKVEEDKELSKATQDYQKALVDLANSKEKDSNVISSNETKELQKKVIKLKNETNDLIDKTNTLSLKNSKNESTKKIYMNQKLILESQLEKLKETKFALIECPECHFVLNKDEEKSFNENKANGIKNLTSQLEELDKNISTLEIVDLTENKKKIEEMTKKYNQLKEDLKLSQDKDAKARVISKETEELTTKVEELNNKIVELTATSNARREENDKNFYAKLEEYNNKISEMENARTKANEIQIVKQNKKSYLALKADLNEKKAILDDFKKEMVLSTKKNVSRIFGDEIEFETIKEQKSGGFVEVCYAKWKNIPYKKSNNSKLLELGVMVLEKLKSFCSTEDTPIDLPIIFDVSDDIGDSVWKSILKHSNAQFFYTKISQKENVKRELKVSKGE